VNIDSNQYSSINSQVVQVSPNVKSSSTTTTSHSSGSTLKSLSVSIRVEHDPISRGSTQTVFVKVYDNNKGNSSKPVSEAHVDGKVIYASHEKIEPFSGITDSKGDMNPPHSWQIGGNSDPGTFRVNAHASSKGYKPASATTAFVVIAKNTANITNTTSTNTTTVLPGNNTSSGGINNSTSDNKVHFYS
jgi:hypothetical protein